jgi:PHS family inorganic phosphate transporter-like MFS transporter
MGKIGSIIGQAGIAKLRTKGATSKTVANPYQNHVMQIYSLFMFLGIFTTLCIPETKRKTLEELSGDEQYTGSSEHIAAVADNNSEEAPKERVVQESAAV